jgi:hypothetical protein
VEEEELKATPPHIEREEYNMALGNVEKLYVVLMSYTSSKLVSSFFLFSFFLSSFFLFGGFFDEVFVCFEAFCRQFCLSFNGRQVVWRLS